MNHFRQIERQARDWDGLTPSERHGSGHMRRARLIVEKRSSTAAVWWTFDISMTEVPSIMAPGLAVAYFLGHDRADIATIYASTAQFEINATEWQLERLTMLDTVPKPEDQGKQLGASNGGPAQRVSNFCK